MNKKFSLALTAQAVQDALLSIDNKIDTSDVVQNLQDPATDKVPSAKAVADSLAVVSGDFGSLGSLAFDSVVNLSGSKATGTLPINKGGTGGTTAQAARTALGVLSESQIDTKIEEAIPEIQTVDLSGSQVQNQLPITSGGTGASSQSQARSNLSVDSTLEVTEKTLRRAVQNAGKTWKGYFSLGFEITSYDHIGVDGNGDFWEYIGNTIPFTVPASLNPIADNRFIPWKLVSESKLLETRLTDMGLNNVGNFKYGVTFDGENDVAIFGGEAYEYVGSSSYPVVVSAGTDPTSDTSSYKKVETGYYSATKALLQSLGLSGNFGFFNKGFIYSEAGDVGVDENNQFWLYNGSLPFEVAKGTVPSEPDYSVFDHTTAVGAHDDIYQRKIKTVALLKSEDPNLYTVDDEVYCDERFSLWTLKSGTPTDTNDYWQIQSDTSGYYWELNPVNGLTTYMFGYVDAFSGDLQPLLQAFDDYIQTTEIRRGIIFKAEGNIGSQLILGRSATGNRPINQENVSYELDLTTTYTDLNNYAVILEEFTLSAATGFIDITCGSVDITSRRQLGAILVTDSERGSFKGRLFGRGGLRYGVTYESSPKTTLMHLDIVRAFDCGLRESATASNIVNTGSANSINQLTTFDLSDFSEYVEEGDIIQEILDDGTLEPHLVKSVTGNSISVFPWFTNTDDGRTLKVNTGGGVYTIGGDSSLINFGRIDGFRCGVLFKNNALYLASVGILHGNNVGTGILVGRDRNAAEGGNIGELYLEGGGNLDMALVETSPAIGGFSISSVIATINQDLIANISGAKPNNVSGIRTRFLSDSFGVDSLVSSPNKPHNNNESSSTRVSSNAIATPLTYYRNIGTVILTPNKGASKNFGLDISTVILMGSGANSQPTGTITLQPDVEFSDWTINGQASITLSGLTNAVRLSVYFRFASKNMVVYKEDLTLA